jgi:Uma2 family endonuclease
MSARELPTHVLEVREEPRFLRHRLTVDEYYRMAEAGVLAHDARVELIDGEIIDMAPIGTRHYWVVTHLSRQLERSVGDTAIVVSQSPVRLGKHNEPEPDLALLNPSTRRDQLPAGVDCFLVIEVSDTTLAYDVKVKAPLYAQHGVPEYWVIDVEKKALRRFAAPQDGSWTDVTVVVSPGVILLPGLDGTTIDLSVLF